MRKAELSPLELVAKAKRERERANKAFSEAVKSAVIAGESPGKVGAAAGLTRQRVYQIAS